MVFHVLLFIFCFLAPDISKAEDLPNFCKTESREFSLCNQSDAPSNITALPKEIEEFSYINQQIQKNFKISELTKFSLSNLDQSLSTGHNSQIDRMYEKFNLLALLSAELKAAQSKYDICFKNCSRTRLIEISDDMKKINKARIALLLSDPLLSSEYFEEIIKDIDQDNINNNPIVTKNVFEKALHKTLKDNLKVMNEKRFEYIDYLKRLNSNTIYEKDQDNVVKTHPKIIKEVLVIETLNHQQLNQNQKNIICKKYREFLSEEKKAMYAGYAIDTALLILPLMAGPLFPLAEEGLLIRYFPKLSRFGMSRETPLLKDLEIATGLGTDVVGLGKAIGEQVTYSKNCHRSELIFIQNPSQEGLEKVKKCQNDYYSDLMVSEMGAVLGVGSLANNTRNAILQIRGLAH